MRTVWLNSSRNRKFSASEWNIVNKFIPKFCNHQEETMDLSQIKKSHQIHLYEIY